MKTLSQVQQQVLAVGILILLLLVLFLLAQPLYQHFRGYDDQIAELTYQRDRFQRSAASVTATERQLEDLKRNDPTVAFYLAESRPALAAADLQKKLHDMVARSGGQVASTRILERERGDPLPSVVVQVHLRSEVEELLELLYQLESGRPLLFVENLVVTANPRRRQRVVRGANQRRVQRTPLPMLDVRFDLVGYTAKEAP